MSLLILKSWLSLGYARRHRVEVLRNHGSGALEENPGAHCVFTTWEVWSTLAYSCRNRVFPILFICGLHFGGPVHQTSCWNIRTCCPNFDIKSTEICIQLANLDRMPEVCRMNMINEEWLQTRKNGKIQVQPWYIAQSGLYDSTASQMGGYCRISWALGLVYRNHRVVKSRGLWSLGLGYVLSIGLRDEYRST